MNSIQVASLLHCDQCDVPPLAFLFLWLCARVLAFAWFVFKWLGALVWRPAHLAFCKLVNCQAIALSFWGSRLASFRYS